MLIRWALPLLGGMCLVAAVLHAVRAQAPGSAVAWPPEPGRNSSDHTVAGSGLVEARSENIAIGSSLAGVVVAVSVRAGQRVCAGEELFRLDDRTLQAER